MFYGGLYLVQKTGVNTARTLYSHPSLLNKKIHQNTKYNLQNYMYIKIANMYRQLVPVYLKMF
jgi:hypothetical protein